MEVTLAERVVIAAHARLQAGLHLQVAVDDERTLGLDERGVVGETFEVSLLGSVDVEMVGIGRGDDTHPGSQPMERAVELVGFYHHIVTTAENIVGGIVFGDASEEGVAVDGTLVHDMGAHGGCGGLAMGACHAESLVGTGERAQHLGALLYLESLLAEEDQFLVVGGDGRGIDHETVVFVLAHVGDFRYILLVVDEHTLTFELSGEV